MKKIICILLILTLLFSCISCKKDDKIDPDDGNNGNKETVEMTEFVIADDGKTDYSIVISSDANEFIRFAASEFKQFFYEMTESILPIVEDTNLSYDSGSKYISIGYNKVTSLAGINIDKNKVTKEGFMNLNKDKSVFLLGGGDNGQMYAIYDFLELTYGMKIYAEDEILLPKIKTAYVPKINYIENPSLQLRSIGSYEFNNNQVFRRRMRTHLRQEGWIYTSHSFFKIMPTDKYYSEHKDWYSPDKTQLCLSNEKMTAEFINNLYNLYNMPQYLSAVNCMLGIEDSNTFCTCEKCTARTKKYKESGIMIQFMNSVYDGLKTKFLTDDDKSNDNREIKLFMYAYFKTLSAPVNAKDEPIDETVIPNANTGVMIAPLQAKYDYPLNHPNNADIKNQISSWSKIFTKNIYMYIYGAHYGAYALPVNNFSSFKQNVEYFSEYGAIGLFELDSYNALSSDLSELKNYLESQLLWNVNQNSEDLIKEFVEAYYKDAAPYILEYINILRLRYLENELKFNKFDVVHTTASKTWLKTDYWPLDFLNACADIFEKAQNSILKYKDTDTALYLKLQSRITQQTIFYQFFKIELYGNIIPVSEVFACIEKITKDCGDVGISSTGEHIKTSPLIADYFKKWNKLAISRVE